MEHEHHVGEVPGPAGVRGLDAGGRPERVCGARSGAPGAPPGSARAAGGFTLVELLVVLTVIGVLAALAFPVFAAVRKSAAVSACMSNHRQIHTALSMYIEDWDGIYPRAVNPADWARPERWFEDPAFGAIVRSLPQFHPLMLPYTRSKEIFHCPSDYGLLETDWLPGWGITAKPSSYAVLGTSYFYRSNLTSIGATDARITRPADTMVLLDAAGEWHGSQYDPARPWEAGRLYRYNVLFADGHVRNLFHWQMTPYGYPPSP